MGELIERVVEAGGDAVIEAGTGTGKSLAYLVALILAGRTVIVSTSGKALQDQLSKKDVPFLIDALPVEFTYAVLKGRSNYACVARVEKLRHQLSQSLLTEFAFKSDTAGLAWPSVNGWIAQEQESEGVGDLEALPMALPDELKHAVTISSDECTGKKCPAFDRCFPEWAKAKAKAAQHQHDRWVIDSRRERIWGQAKVPSIYDGLTLETWVEEVVRRGGDRQQATALIRALRRWLETTSWLLLLGPPSAGKTGIAIALMWELAGRGFAVYFVNASDMVMRIRGTFDRPDQSEVEMFDSLAEAPVLVIDDLGKQAMTPYARELYYRLFNARWGNGLRTIMPSNLAKAEELKAHVGEAVYDRLIQVAKVAPVDPGVNLRIPRRAIAGLR